MSNTSNDDMQTRMTPGARRAVLAASLGTLIEWYDYMLFGVAAALVINPIFFPEKQGLMALLAVTATFAVGFLVRPIGGLIIANLGDRIGRKPTLIFTILLMSLGTVGIGLLPTAAQIGIWAPILLVLFRAIQGFGAGAELSGALSIVAEFAPPNRRGLVTGLINGTSGGGQILAVVFFLAVSQLPNSELFSWGWRIPFLFAGVLCIVALWVRKRLDESPEWIRAQEAAEARGERGRTPLLQVLRERPMMVFRGFLLWSGHNCVSYLCIGFSITYLMTVSRMPRSDALTIQLAASVCFLIASPFYGWISDRVGHRKMMFIAMALTIALVVPFMLAVQSGDFWLSFIAIVSSACLFVGMSNGVIGSVATNMFEARYRYSGLTIGKELNAALIGGPTPLIAAALLSAGGGKPWYVAAFVAATALMTMGAMVSRDGRVGRMNREPGMAVPVLGGKGVPL